MRRVFGGVGCPSSWMVLLFVCYLMCCGDPCLRDPQRGGRERGCELLVGPDQYRRPIFITVLLQQNQQSSCFFSLFLMLFLLEAGVASFFVYIARDFCDVKNNSSTKGPALLFLNGGVEFTSSFDLFFLLALPKRREGLMTFPAANH